MAGAALIGIGVSLYITEFWRDPEGRGQVLHGALDAPQVAAIALVAGLVRCSEWRRIRSPAAERKTSLTRRRNGTT